jgi:hypothetical protein
MQNCRASFDHGIEVDILMPVHRAPFDASLGGRLPRRHSANRVAAIDQRPDEVNARPSGSAGDKYPFGLVANDDVAPSSAARQKRLEELSRLEPVR